ncbi:MAG: hypothetical protein QOG87_2630 [Actinomycetota bacterium]|jgi:hypothetical protein
MRVVILERRSAAAGQWTGPERRGRTRSATTPPPTVIVPVPGPVDSPLAERRRRQSSRHQRSRAEAVGAALARLGGLVLLVSIVIFIVAAAL